MFMKKNKKRLAFPYESFVLRCSVDHLYMILADWNDTVEGGRGSSICIVGKTSSLCISNGYCLRQKRCAVCLVIL